MTLLNQPRLDPLAPFPTQVKPAGLCTWFQPAKRTDSRSGQQQTPTRLRRVRRDVSSIGSRRKDLNETLRLRPDGRHPGVQSEFKLTAEAPITDRVNT
jgi:hypothetical protein